MSLSGLVFLSARGSSPRLAPSVATVTCCPSQSPAPRASTLASTRRVSGGTTRNELACFRASFLQSSAGSWVNTLQPFDVVLVLFNNLFTVCVWKQQQQQNKNTGFHYKNYSSSNIYFQHTCVSQLPTHLCVKVLQVMYLVIVHLHHPMLAVALEIFSWTLLSFFVLYQTEHVAFLCHWTFISSNRVVWIFCNKLG